MEQSNDLCIAIMPAHTKCGNDLIRMLLLCKMRVVGFFPFLQNAESLRSQLSINWQDRFFSEQCDSNNMASIEPSILKAKMKVGNVDFLILPVPAYSDEPKDEEKMQIFYNINQNGLNKFMNKYVEYLMPPVREQRIWMVDYSFGMEYDVIERVIRELFTLPKLARPLNTKFMNVNHIKGLNNLFKIQ